MYNINFKHFSKEIVAPTLLVESDNFLIKIVETEEELRKTLRLRYEIFNLEQGKGQSNANLTGIDFDEYDEYCLQVIVVDKTTNNPVGTYRVHLGLIATKAMGFYASTEYKITGLDKIASNSIEVGRSCVLPKFRTGAVIALLWRGLGILMFRSKFQYLFGCVSMEESNAAISWALYEYFNTCIR